MSDAAQDANEIVAVAAARVLAEAHGAYWLTLLAYEVPKEVAAELLYRFVDGSSSVWVVEVEE